MKKLLPLLFVLTAPLVAQGGRTTTSPIVFNGLIVQDGQTKVSLHNPNTGDTKWVVVGKKFGRYTVGFQPGVPGKTADTVVLTLGASSQRITLQGSADPAAAAIAAKTALVTSLTDILTRVRSAPNAEPETIQLIESYLSDAQAVVGAPSDITVSTVNGTGNGQHAIINGGFGIEVIINNVTGAFTIPDPFANKSSRNPDGSIAETYYDASGRALAVSTRDASGRVLSVSTPPTPNPAAPATSPAAAK